MDKVQRNKNLFKQPQKQKPKNIIPLSIQQSSIYNKFVRLRRPQSKTNTKFSKQNDFRPSFKINFRLSFFILTGILISFFVFNIIKYSAINPQPYDGDKSVISSHNSDNRKTILFTVLDDRVKDYRFADMIVIVDMDYRTNIAKLYTINPLFLSRSAARYNLKTLWNNLSTENRLAEYIDEVEFITGIKIDSYIVSTKSDLNDTLKNSASFITANDIYSIDNKVINKGDNIKISEAAALLIGKEKVNNDLLILQQSILKAYLDQFKNKLFLYELFINPDQFLKTFKTNLDKVQFINLFLDLSNFEIINNSSAIMKSDLGEPSETDPTIIVPNYTKLDENINYNFRDFEVIKEQAQLEVYNATNGSGIASRYQRQIQNRGGNIIKIGNYSEVSETTRVYLDLKKVPTYNYTLNLIYDLLPSNVRILDISEYKYNYSGDIVIILGKDILN